MALTATQLTAVKAAVFAETDPAVVEARAGSTRHDFYIMNWLNAAANPAVSVWRNDVSKDDLIEATVDSLGQFDNLTQGKRDAWAIYLQSPTFDMRKNKIRSAVNKCWAATEQAAIHTGSCVRDARRVEVVLNAGATDTTEGTVTAKKFNDFMGSIDIMDVSRALNLP